MSSASGLSPGRRRPPVTVSPAPADLAARVRNAQRGLRGRLEDRAALLEVVRAVNSSLQPEQIAELLISRAAGWLPASCWVLVGFDRTGQTSLLAEQGFEPDMKATVDAVADSILRHGTILMSADAHADSRIPGAGQASVAAFPLSCRGHRVAALIGLDREPSTHAPDIEPAFQRAFEELLEPAGSALYNARLLRRAESQAAIDDLTRLYNLRYLSQALRRETKRALRARRPLSLLFLDLDFFKSINDAHGHLFGSRALVETAVVIRG